MASSYDKSKDPLYPAFHEKVFNNRVTAVSPNDTTDLPLYANKLYITGAGNIKVIPVGNDDATPVTFAVAANSIFDLCRVRRVFNTLTTATGIYAVN